jgi:hypothetical protein
VPAPRLVTAAHPPPSALRWTSCRWMPVPAPSWLVHRIRTGAVVVPTGCPPMMSWATPVTVGAVVSSGSSTPRPRVSMRHW